MTGRQSFVGSAATIAATINEFVQADAADGYILVPHSWSKSIGAADRPASLGR